MDFEKALQERMVLLRREHQAASNHLQIITGAIKECANTLKLIADSKAQKDAEPEPEIEAFTEGKG